MFNERGEGKVNQEVMPLAMIPPGKKGRVIYTKDYGKGLLNHMADMGLSEGSVVEVITAGGSGPLLIGVKETRLAIGQGIARKIMVERGD